MCGSGSNSNCCCCPNAVVFQEKICGNLQGPLTEFPAWQAPTPENDYFQGTFEIFNAGTGIINATVTDTSGFATQIGGANGISPGNSISVSVNNPASLIVTVPMGTHGKFCITLFKRLFG